MAAASETIGSAQRGASESGGVGLPAVSQPPRPRTVNLDGMALVCGVVPSGPGRPQLDLVGSPGGLAVHLFDPTVPGVLCKGLRGKVVVFINSRFAPLFDGNGCQRCAREAAKRGYTVLIDFDANRVVLDGFVPAWSR
jgi:hypothetical protein